MKKHKDLLLLIFTTIILIISIINHLPYGHDLYFHLYRLQGIKEALQAHSFPIYIYPYHNYDFGYGSPLLYCDLFMFIPGLLYTLGLPIMYCYKMIYIVFIIIGNTLMIRTLRKIYKENEYVVCIGYLLYCFCGSRISDIFVRNAISSFIAYSFIPLVLLSIYEIIYNKKDSWLLLGFSFSFILLSHILTFIICCICFLIVIVINIKKIIINKSYITIFKGIIFGVCLSAFFLFPYEYSRRVGMLVVKGEHNYKVYYKGTIIQKISLLLSILTLLYTTKYCLLKKHI